MLQTKFTELLGCTVPLQQAGMGKIAAPERAAAVAEAGGLGMVSGIASAPPEYVAKILDGLRRSTSGAFGANFIVAGVRESGTLDADFLKVLEVAASRAPVVEFFYEDPDPELVEIAHAGGALVSWQLGSAAEAVAAEEAGCDLIVAQGTEAGGHVRGKIGLLALLSEVLPSVKVPVVAAGGIGPGGPWPQPSRPAPRQYGWARGSSLRRRRGPIPRTSTSSTPPKRRTRSSPRRSPRICRTRPIAACGPPSRRSIDSGERLSARPRSRGLRTSGWPSTRVTRSSLTRGRRGTSTRCLCGPGSPSVE